jgi:DNA-directed RNA polymerase omega subunit
MIKPRLDTLLERADSHYATVLMAAKRARQINS